MVWNSCFFHVKIAFVMNKKLLVGGCFLLGVIFVIFAVVYFVTPAESLPAFLPGHTAGLAKTHYKHGIGALLIGLLLFALGWFQSGKKKSKVPSESSV